MGCSRCATRNVPAQDGGGKDVVSNTVHANFVHRLKLLDVIM